MESKGGLHGFTTKISPTKSAKQGTNFMLRVQYAKTLQSYRKLRKNLRDPVFVTVPFWCPVSLVRGQLNPCHGLLAADQIMGQIKKPYLICHLFLSYYVFFLCEFFGEVFLDVVTIVAPMFSCGLWKCHRPGPGHASCPIALRTQTVVLFYV